jgi:hypothetical protein
MRRVFNLRRVPVLGKVFFAVYSILAPGEELHCRVPE